MKNITKFLTVLAASALALTSCIKEVVPVTNYATSEQIAESASAMEASVNGIPAKMQEGYMVYGSQTHETDMAFPQFMIAFTELLGDIYPLGTNSGYDWYRNYNTFDRAFGDNSYFAYLPWFTCYQFIKSANDIIGAVDLSDDSLTASVRAYAVLAERKCACLESKGLPEGRGGSTPSHGVHMGR